MKKGKYSKDIYQAIHSYLEERNHRFSFEEDDDNDGIFEFMQPLMGKISFVRYLIILRAKEYLVMATCPLTVDLTNDQTKAAMTEFVCRANYGLKNGNFELDVRDGEIRYKVYVDCDGIIPSEDIIRRSISCPSAMFMRYGEGIVNVMFGQESAEEAIDKCEGDSTGRTPMSMGRMAEELDKLISQLEARVKHAEAEDDSDEIMSDEVDQPDSYESDLWDLIPPDITFADSDLLD